MGNIHDRQIPKEILDEALTSLNAIKDALAPFVNILTIDNRKKMPKMGNKSLSFVVKAYEYRQLHPELRPAFKNQGDYDIDVADATGLLALKDVLTQLLSEVEDTMMLAGSEALQHSLLIYNNAKMAARNNVAGAKEIYEDLSARFPGRPKNKPDEGDE